VTLESLSARIRVLLVPGGGGSGPDHWHTYCEAEDARAERVVQADWECGRREEWVAALDRHIQAAQAPVVLAAHSLGAISVAHWAAVHSGPVIGALLVAPADIDGDWVKPGSLYEGFRPIPMAKLPFPSVMAASTNDPYLSLDRANEFGDAWGSRIENVGPLQHIGSNASCNVGQTAGECWSG
jgi:predicted alpha/beta hydrolase family esterase